MQGLQHLTQRQVEILKSLIEEYINTAEAVGSETLEKKHNLSASPATIRNEMVRLTEMGYLKKPHLSAGRMPTPEGMKFYVNELMKEKGLSVGEEVALKEKIWDYRDEENKFLKQVVRSLADKTRALAIAADEQGELYVAGYSNILDMPEFYDIDITKNLLNILDHNDYLHKLIMSDISSEPAEDSVRILLGDDLSSVINGPYGMVYSRFCTPGKRHGAIGVIGPVRLNYMQIVPTVRALNNLIEEIAIGW